MTSTLASPRLDKTRATPRVDATDKQIMMSVRHGRKCTFNPIDYNSVTGYVFGMDRYSYLVAFVDEGVLRKALIHKGSCPVIELHEESTLDDEPQEVRDSLLQAIGPFRSWVNGQTSRTENSRHA